MLVLVFGKSVLAVGCTGQYFGEPQCKGQNRGRTDGSCQLNPELGTIIPGGNNYWKWSWCTGSTNPVPTIVPTFTPVPSSTEVVPTPVSVLPRTQCTGQYFGEPQCRGQNSGRTDGSCQLNPELGTIIPGGNNYWKWSWCMVEFAGDYNWETIGPSLIVDTGHDGGRSLAVSQDGDLKIIGTWENGVWLEENGLWRELVGSDRKDEIGVVREIRIMEGQFGVKVVMVSDNGVQVVKKTGNSVYEVRHWRQPREAIGPLQTLSFSGTDLWVAGFGGAFRYSNWQESEELVNVEGRFMRMNGELPATVRSLVVDPNDSEVVYLGGWWGYSAVRAYNNGQMMPGLGVWKSENGGVIWRQVLSDINVNVIWVCPENSNIVVVGTEGKGNVSNRTPSVYYPSFFISFDGGESWDIFNPPLDQHDYDVAAVRGLVWIAEKEMLVYTMWGGPVGGVIIPSGATKDNTFSWMRFVDEDRSEYFAGQLASFVDSQGRRFLVTGGKHYWNNGATLFTQLARLLVR